MSLFLMVKKYSIVYMYHKFLIHSSVIGHLGCFQSLATVNSAWWTFVYRSLYCILSYLFLGRCPGVVSLDLRAVLSLVFWGMSILLSIVAVLICIPTSSV
jgi:hypothetical protein